MSFVAVKTRPKPNPLVATGLRPGNGSLEKFAADSAALVCAGHNQGLNFGVTLAGNEWNALDMTQPDQLFPDLRNCDQVVWPCCEAVEPERDLFGRGSVAQAWQKRGDGSGICIGGRADDHGGYL